MKVGRKKKSGRRKNRKKRARVRKEGQKQKKNEEHKDNWTEGGRTGYREYATFKTDELRWKGGLELEGHIM